MDASQWPQHHDGGLARTMEEIQSPPNNMINSNNMATISTNSRASQMVEKRTRPQKEQNLNCPRCNSTNTKFCYYNNYSLTQPRYFCKTCRRYWTQGGSLRNVPVGGGSRKNKRCSSSSPSILGSSSSSSAAAAAMSNASTSIMHTKLIPDLNPPNTLQHLITGPQNSSKFLEAQDLNLAFPMGPEAINVNGDIPNSTPSGISTTTTTTTNSCGGGTGNSPSISALELLRSGIASRGSLNSYVPMPILDPNSPLCPSGLPNLQEFKPSVGVFTSSHGGDHGTSNNENSIIGGARLLFPFADMNKLASSAITAHHHPEVDDESKGGNDHHHQHHHNHHHHHHQGPTGYWSGMLGGGAW